MNEWLERTLELQRAEVLFVVEMRLKSLPVALHGARVVSLMSAGDLAKMLDIAREKR
jgi:hypothetical protein